MKVLARQSRTWPANETWRLTIILAVVKSQMLWSQPYWDEVSTTHTESDTEELENITQDESVNALFIYCMFPDACLASIPLRRPSASHSNRRCA